MTKRFLITAGLVAAATLTMGAPAQDSGDVARDPDPDRVQETLTAVETRDPGTYVADSRFMTLYTLADAPNVGELGAGSGGAASGGTASGEGAVAQRALPCTGECLEAWPPLTIEPGAEPTVTEALNPDLVGTTELEDGTVQVTYAGWPLFYFSGDEAAGDLSGMGTEAFGGTWYTVSSNDGALLQSPDPNAGD